MAAPLLALLALGLAAATLAHYARLVRAVRVPLAPRAHQGAMAVAGVAAGVALVSGPGWLGGAAAGAVVLMASAFLVLTTASRLPPQRPAVAVGERAPDFTAPDADGRPFALAGLRGRPLLLKFFRGHW
jgi:hypothetical protein